MIYSGRAELVVHVVINYAMERSEHEMPVTD
jgi:hypothetical protein